MLKKLVSYPKKFGLNPVEQWFSNYSVYQDHVEGLL